MLNPSTGLPFFSKREVMQLSKTIEGSYLNNLIPTIRQEIERLGETQKGDQYIETATRDGSFIECFYLTIQGVTVTIMKGYLLAAAGEEKEWIATLALEIAGATPLMKAEALYVVVENVPARNMKHIRGPITILDPKHADRIISMLNR